MAETSGPPRQVCANLNSWLRADNMIEDSGSTSTVTGSHGVVLGAITFVRFREA